MTVVGLPIFAALACVLVVYVGTTVQASLGIGLGMLSSPVLALTDSDFIPVAIILAVIPLSSSVAWSERAHIDRRGAWSRAPCRRRACCLGPHVQGPGSPATRR